MVNHKLHAFFAGRIRYRIEGLNLSRLISTITSSGIILYEITPPHSRAVSFSVVRKDRKKLIALCEKLCYNPIEESARGLVVVLARQAQRPGLIIGLLALIALVGLYNSFIWQIKIEGNERIAKTSVFNTLKEAGIRKGTARYKIDKNSTANLLTAAFEDASMVYVSVRGTTLHIQVVETLEKEETLDRNTPLPLAAPADGRVDSLIVFRGTPLVKPGDIVKAGQTLIANYELIPDPSDPEAEPQRVYVRAQGQAEMTVWYTARLTFAETAIEYARTGKFAIEREIELMGWSWGKSGANGFELYETVREQKNLFYGCILPFKRTETIYYELERREIVRSFAENEERLRREAEFEALAKVPADAKIIERTTNVSGAAGLYSVTGIIAVEITTG